MLEKCVHDSLMTYGNDLMRIRFQTQSFLWDRMFNTFLEALNNSQIMVDFRKVFELVDHTLLLKKLRYYEGLDGV